MSVELKEPNSRMEVLSYLDWILQSPMNPYDTFENVIANVLTGNYEMLTCYKDSKPVGLVIFKIQDRNCFIVLNYIKNNLKCFYDLFLHELRSRNVFSMTSLTMRNKDAIARLMKMEPVYTLMRRII